MKVRTLVGRYAGEIRDIRPREALLMIKDGRAEPLTASPLGGQFPVPASSTDLLLGNDDRQTRAAMFAAEAEAQGLPANAARLNAGLVRPEKTSLLRRKRASEQ